MTLDQGLTDNCGELVWPLTGGYVKHMYSNILCVQKQILHTPALLSGCSVGRHSFGTLPGVPDALLRYAEYAQVAERPPSKELCEQRRGRKISRLFSAYETNVWHSTEHRSAVDLSVNRQQYARACWQLI